MAGESWIDRIDLEEFWRWGRPAAITGLVVSGLAVAAAALPSPLVPPTPVLIPLLFGVFPLQLGSIATFRRAERPSLDAVLDTVPRVVRWLFTAATALFVFAVVLSFRGSGVETERRGDRYFASDKGELTEIDHDEYVRRNAAKQLSLASGVAPFYALALAASLSSLAHQKDHEPTPSPNRSP